MKYSIVITKTTSQLFSIRHGKTVLGYYCDFRDARSSALDMAKLLAKIEPGHNDYVVDIHRSAWQDFLQYKEGKGEILGNKVEDEAIGIEPEPTAEEFGC